MSSALDRRRCVGLRPFHAGRRRCRRGLCRRASLLRGADLSRSRTRSATSSARATTRARTKNMTPFAYGHGYVNGTKWRDIMSYKASCDGCPRIPFWSNPTIKFKGEPCRHPRLRTMRGSSSSRRSACRNSANAAADPMQTRTQLPRLSSGSMQTTTAVSADSYWLGGALVVVVLCAWPWKPCAR